MQSHKKPYQEADRNFVKWDRMELMQEADQTEVGGHIEEYPALFISAREQETEDYSLKY